MKNFFNSSATAVITLFILTNFLGSDAYSQNKPKVDLEQYMKLTNPGPQHEILFPLEGSWKVTWVQNPPKGEEILGLGTAEVKLILQGRYLEIDELRTMMSAHIEARRFIGYDNRKQKYFTIMIDELGTYSTYAEGDYDSVKKQINLFGVDDDPLLDKKTPIRIQITFERENKFTFIMFVNEKGKEFKTMEVRYIRQ